MRILLVLLLCVQICYSQTSCFDVLFDGYNISSITDDHQFIWVGTFDNGLISYNKDTNEIQFYNTSNSMISSNSIQSVLKSNNRLYVSSENSLMAFINNSFHEISTTIQGVMTIAPNGNLAVGAPYEFNILDLDNEITYTKDLLSIVTPSCCGKSTGIEYDNNGRLWLSNYAFYEYDILSYDGVIWNVYDTTNSILPIESFSSLNGITTHDNHVYASNWVGLFKFENNTWTKEHSQDNPTILNNTDHIEGLVVNAIKYDSQGILWVGAGEYDNIGSGKIAYREQDSWEFLNNNSEMLPGINLFEESQFDSDIIYAASNDGLFIIDKSCLVLSTEEFVDENQITIFPNPTRGILNIKMKNRMPFSFQLINPLGQVIMSETDFLNTTIDVSKFASGVYNLVIESEGSVLNKKILKHN